MICAISRAAINAMFSQESASHSGALEPKRESKYSCTRSLLNRYPSGDNFESVPSIDTQYGYVLVRIAAHLCEFERMDVAWNLPERVSLTSTVNSPSVD